MNDDDYDSLVNYLSSQTYPSSLSKTEKYILRRKSKKYFWDAGQGNLWFIEKDNRRRLVIKGHEQKLRVFEECHQSEFGGHVGRDNTARKIKDRYYWPDYYKDIKLMIENCDRCQRNAKESERKVDVLHPIPVTAKPWYMVGIDLIDAHTKTEKGNRYIITQTDYFTKYVEAYPIPEKSSYWVAKGIYQSFCRHGAPVHLISDQGREFVNHITEELFANFKVKQRITSAYHPQSNGLDERTNQTLKRTLRKLVNDNSKDWDEFIDGALFALNTNISTTTKFSPFYLMFGRDPVLPLEGEVQCQAEAQCQEADQEEMVAHRMQKLKEIHEKIFPQVSENIKDAQEKQKIQYQNKKTIPCLYNVGDLVLRRNMLQKTRKGHKMEDNWFGPFAVLEINPTNGTCSLKNPTTGNVLKRKVPMKQLKKYHSPTNVSSTCNSTEANINKPSCGNNHQSDPVVNMKSPSSKSDHQTVNFCKEKITNLTTQTITKMFETEKIISHLKGICNLEVGSWRMDVLNKRSPNNGLKRNDLAFNVHFGCFSDEQTDTVVDLLLKHFPEQDLNTVSKVLFPEALILICSTVLAITFKEAEKYLINEEDLEVLSHKHKRSMSTFNKSNKKSKTTIDTCSTSFEECQESDSDEFSPVKQGIPSYLQGIFQKSYPAFTTTDEGNLLVEMIVDGRIQFEGNPIINKSDLQALAGYNAKKVEDKWLSNFIIDEYLEIIKSASEKRIEVLKWAEFEKIFGRVSTEKLLENKENLLQQDIVFIPMNSSCHWELGIVFLKERNIVLLDSKAKKNVQNISYTRISSVMSLLDQLEPTSFDFSKWSFYVNDPKDIQQQNNSFDCGVFVCIFARSIATGCPLIEQHTIQAFRKLMVLELHQKRLCSIAGHLKADKIITLQ